VKKIICAIVLLSVALGVCACSNGKAGVEMTAVIIELRGGTALVEPVENDSALASSDRISFSTSALDDIGAQVGDTVRILYSGEIMESYPAQIIAAGWSIVKKAAP
jgi:hypothetical protein